MRVCPLRRSCGICVKSICDQINAMVKGPTVHLWEASLSGKFAGKVNTLRI